MQWFYCIYRNSVSTATLIWLGDGTIFIFNWKIILVIYVILPFNSKNNKIENLSHFYKMD